jgi:protoporphyrinogen oxidase
MGTASVIESLGEARSFQTRHGYRIAIVGGGLLGTTLALRYRQAGRIVTVYEAADRVERRGHGSIASRDRFLLGLLDELGLASRVRWDAPRQPGVRFGDLAGGRARIVETLRDRARSIDVDVRVSTPVREISPLGPGFAVNTGSDTGEFDEVVLTVPAPVASALLPSLPDGERLALLGVEYVGIINVSFALARRPEERYIYHATRGRDTFAVLNPGALSPLGERRAVVYVTRPLVTNDELFYADDRHVIEHFARALPGDANILTARVIRTPHAFARRRLASFTSSVPGLSIVNAAHLAGGRHHLERTAALATAVFRTLCAERIF